MADAATSAPRFRAAARQAMDGFTAVLLGREKAELLLGFPAAPFILPLSTDVPTQFTEYAKHQPAHAVRLRRTGPAGQTEWTVSPWADQDAYRLTFNLPERIESWISENEERRFKRLSDIKTNFIYMEPPDRPIDHLPICQWP